MNHSAQARKQIGEWLKKATASSARNSALQGFFHDETGFLYACDGARVHGIDKMSDRTGKVRCPSSSEIIDVDIVPDIGRIVHDLIEDDYTINVSPKHLYAAASALSQGAKKGGFTSAQTHMHLRPQKSVIELTLQDGDGDVRLEAGVTAESVGECELYRDVPFRLAYLLEALEGMLKFGGQPDLELCTGTSALSAVHLRMIPGEDMDVPTDAFALFLPMHHDGDRWSQRWNARLEGRDES